MENLKRRKICTLDGKNSTDQVLNVKFLPNEILMNIFSHLNINDLYKCAQVSKKFRQISHDKSFWKCVNLYNQRVSCEFITQIIKLGTEYLNLQGAILVEDVDTDLPRENNLKYLNLAESSVDDTFLVKLLRSSKSLEKLSLPGLNQKHTYEYYSEFRRPWKTNLGVNMGMGNLGLRLRTFCYMKCLFPNAKMLTTLDLRSTSKGRDPCCIPFESLKKIILVCDQLREANFEYQLAIWDDRDFFANNLTTKIEKLNISYIDILDEHMEKLLKRCKKITELDLYSCGLDRHDKARKDTEQRTLMAISENLSQSLVKLQLPDDIIVHPGFLNSLPKLKYLWHQGRKMKGTPQNKTWIKSLFPQIAINEGDAKIACCNEYSEPKFGFWELKCSAVELDFPRIQ